MKSKTIKKVIAAKLNDWLNSIEDASVRELAKKNTIITGGAIASLLCKEQVKDYDVYFRDKTTTLAVASYYVDKFNAANPNRVNRVGKSATAYVIDCDDEEKVKAERIECRDAGHLLNLNPGRVKIVVRSDGVASENAKHLDEPFEDVFDKLDSADNTNEKDLEKLDGEEKKYRPIFLSANAITLSGRIQIVVRFYGEPSVIHENYDFVHCTNYYDHGKGELVLKPDALECILTKELRYMGSKYPLCSVIRTRKFIQRGFSINAGQYLKMLMQVSKLDLTDVSVLEDQLTGVDSAYFGMIIHALNSKLANDPNFKVDETYVATIIDRIF